MVVVKLLPFVATALLLASCSDPQSLPQEPIDPVKVAPRIIIISGDKQTDTINATLALPIVVEVRDTLDRPARDVEIVFSNTGYMAASQILYFDEFDRLQYSLTLRTDSLGRASARFRLSGNSTFAGAMVVVRALGARAESFVYVRPGTFTHMTAAPRDTTIVVGGQSQLRAFGLDRYNNSGDLAQFTATSTAPAVQVTGTTAQGVAFGRARVAVSSQYGSDTVTINVVPAAIIAGVVPTGNNQITVKALHVAPGRVFSSQATQPEWLEANRLLFVRSQSLVTTDTLGGNETNLVPQFSGSLPDAAPQLGPNGTIYFIDKGIAGQPDEIWKVQTNGTGLARVLQDAARPILRSVSPSPDGTRLVYAAATATTATPGLFVLDLATGTITPLGVSGRFVRWSPDGSWIGYTLLDRVIRSVTPAGAGGPFDFAVGSNEGAFDFSPDGRYIVTDGGVVVDVATRAFAVMNGTVAQPAWRP